MGPHGDWVRHQIGSYMDQGMARDKAFHRFRAANWKSIIEWEEHLQKVADVHGGVIPPMWEGVRESVMAAIVRTREALKDADELEASDWRW